MTPIELVIAPEVLRELAEAYAWYEEQRRGLGEEFLNCVDAAIETIRRHPDMNAVAHGVFRRALARRFPYAIFYEHGRGVVTLFAVFHCAQDPEKRRKRLG